MGNLNSKLFLYVIGDPVSHSLSPMLHNQAYAELGVQDKFYFSARKVSPEELSIIVEELKAASCGGCAVTAPHKESIIPLLDRVDSLAQKIGAVNTVKNEQGKLIGYNTDICGITAPLMKLRLLSGANVAVLGAGGAARAAIYGLVEAGATVQIFNRTASRAEALAEKFGARCAGYSLEKIDQIRNADIILNTTPVGMGCSHNDSPLPEGVLSADQIVYDIIYNPAETRLITQARAAGATVVYGLEMFLAQAIEQIRIFTGLMAPEEDLRLALIDQLQS